MRERTGPLVKEWGGNNDFLGGVCSGGYDRHFLTHPPAPSLKNKGRGQGMGKEEGVGTMDFLSFLRFCNFKTHLNPLLKKRGLQC